MIVGEAKENKLYINNSLPPCYHHYLINRRHL